MKTYKDFNKRFIGISDYAKLIMVGCTDEGVTAKTLSFHGDNSYSAYIVTEPATIGEHYEKVAEFRSWLKIYDDRELTAEFNGQKINVYRAGDYGCIIEIADVKENK